MTEPKREEQGSQQSGLPTQPPPGGAQAPFSQPSFQGQPAWKTKSAPMWPLWAVFGAIVVGFLMVNLFWKGDDKPVTEGVLPDQNVAPVNPSAPTVKTRTDQPISGFDLNRGWDYMVGAEFRAVEHAGDDVKAAEARTLAAGTQIHVISLQFLGGTKWYEVSITGNDGKSAGKGFVPARMLDGLPIRLAPEPAGSGTAS